MSHRRSWMQLLSAYHYSQVADMVLSAAQDDNLVISDVFAEALSDTSPSYQNTQDLCEILLIRSPSTVLNSVYSRISSFEASKEITRGYQTYFTLFARLFRTVLAKVCTLISFSFDFDEDKYEKAYVQAIVFLKEEVTAKKLYSPAYMPLLQQACSYLRDDGRDDSEMFTLLQEIANLIVKRSTWAQFSSDRRTYVVSKDAVDHFVWNLFRTEITEPVASNGEIRVKKYRKVANWLIMKTFGRVTSLSSSANLMANAYSSVTSYSEQLNIYNGEDEIDKSLIQKIINCKSQSLIESTDCSELSLFKNIMINDTECVEETIKNYGTIDELFVYTTPELVFPTLTINNGYGGHLDIPILFGLFAEDISEDSFISLSASILYTVLGQSSFLDTVSLIMSIALAKQHTSVAPLFDLVSFFLWCCKQNVKDNLVTCPKHELITTLQSSSSTELPANWSALSNITNNSQTFYSFMLTMFSFMFLSLTNHPIISSSLLSSYSGSIERQMLSSYSQNNLFSTPFINFFSAYSESFKELPSFIRLSTSTDEKDSNDVVTLLNRSVVDIIFMVPYGLLLLLLKQGFHSLRKLIIEQTIVLTNTDRELEPSNTSFIAGLLHLFDSFVVEPLYEPHHSDAHIFIANSCIQSLVRTGYLLDVYILRLLFPLPTPATEVATGFLKYRAIETLVFLQDIDLLSFYINECTGTELFLLVSKMHAYLNITFILSYRTLREGPGFCNEFLTALNKSLDGDGACFSNTRLPYEILLSIYEFSYTLPWMGTVKEATPIKAFFSIDYSKFQETQTLVTALGNYLSSLAVPNVVTHLHRISGHIVYGSILSTSHYKKVSSDFMHCLIADGTDPTFLVASLVDSCFPREVKSRILFSDSALSTAYTSDTVSSISSSHKTTANQTGNSKDVPIPVEHLTFPEVAENGILPQVPSYTGSDRIEPFGYLHGYLCVLQVIRDLMFIFVNEKKEETRERIRSVITLIVVKCNLLLSPLPMMNSMLFEGGSIDSGIYSWFVTMIYLSFYQSITLCEVKKKELFLEQTQIIQSIHNNKALLETSLANLSIKIPQFDSAFNKPDTLNSSALLSMVNALQKVVNTQIRNLRTPNLSEPDNPFNSIITTKLGLFVDKITSIKAIIQDIDSKIAEFDSSSASYASSMGMKQIYNGLQSNRLNEYVSNVETGREALTTKRIEYNNTLTQLFKEIEEADLTEEVNNLLQIRDLISEFNKNISCLNTFTRKIQRLEKDIKRIHNWFIGDSGLFSGRFTSNLFWIKSHMKAIYEQTIGNDKFSISTDIMPDLLLDFSAIDANCVFSMEELRESRFSERQYIHAEYTLRMACILLNNSAKDSSEEFLAMYEQAVRTRFSKCEHLPFYWHDPPSCKYKHSFFTFLDQESSIFTLTIRSTVPPVKFENMLTEYENLFTIANSSQIGIEFILGSYMSINPLWLSAQFTIDTIEKIATSEDAVPAIAFLYGALSKASEIYLRPIKVFLSHIHHLFHNSKTMDCAKLGEMSKYYSSHNEYYAFKQAYTFANPGYAGSLSSSNAPYFYSIPGELGKAIAKLTHIQNPQVDSSTQARKEFNNGTKHVKTVLDQHRGMSYDDMCHYYAQTTLLPMLYSLVPRYLFIHSILKQYIANKGNKSISKLPLLLMKPHDHDAQAAGLHIADTDGLPMMGPRSYSKLASRCKSFGLLCGKIFSQRMPIKRCFDLEMLVLMGVMSSFGMLLPDVIVFGVYLALSMYETNPYTQTGVLTSYAILFHFMDNLISGKLLNDMLNNVTHMKLQMIMTTLKLTPFFSKYPPHTWQYCSIPKVLSYFLFDKLPQGEGSVKDIVQQFLYQGTEQLIYEIKSEYETALGRLNNSVDIVRDLQSRVTMELLLDHPISVLRGRIDKVTHVLLIANNVFQKNTDIQYMFNAAMKRRTYELMERAHNSSNFDTEQSNTFIYHASRELPLAIASLSDELIHLKKSVTNKGQGQQFVHKQRHQKNKSNTSHHNS